MTTYAMNEIETLVRKAAIGAGLDPGRADDLAAAGLWLAFRAFPVCELVHRALAAGPGEPLRLSADGTTAECPLTSAAHSGPAVLDLLLAKPPGFRVVLNDLDELRLLVALAAVMATRHQQRFRLEWGETLLPIGPGANPAAAAVTAGAVRRLSAIRAPAAARPGAAAPDPAETSVTRYDPDATTDTGWAALQVMAARTYVPASEQSRRSGAGAGLNDND
jgi:hypothetical protein